MAGASNEMKSHFPHGGDGGYFNIILSMSHVAEMGDTSGLKKVAAFKAPFDFNVKKAWLWIREGGWVDGTTDAIAVVDDSASVITVVASFSLSTAHDAGTFTELTVADEGPILTNGELALQYDSGDASGEAHDLSVHLWCRPRFF